MDLWQSTFLAGATPLVKELSELGVERCLCVATSRGAGAGPDDRVAPDPIVVEVQATDMMMGIRRSLEVFAHLPPDAIAKIDAFDPDGTAGVLGTIFDDGRPLAGRRKYGGRPAEWQDLEDKTTVDAFWDDAGIAHAPSEVVAARGEALEAARVRLDRGQGVVFSGDSRDGFNGGATYVRWVRGKEQSAIAAEFFQANCDRTRVMPFLEGIPCSIHGFVFDDTTIALRPCEMLVFRRPATSELHYGRAATFWDPPDADRAAMREIARRVGEHLRKTLSYRGAFTVDGILGSDGFLPTELNPRFGAALAVMTAKLGIPLILLNAAVVEGEPVDWQPRELERRILEVADQHRSGGGMAMTRKKQTETKAVSLVWERGAFRIGVEGDEPDASAILGPSAMGGFLKVELVPERTPVGPSAAGRVALALRCLDQHWDLEIGELEPARDVPILERRMTR